MLSIRIICWLLLYPCLLAAQPDISGAWVGTITQNEGGIRDRYEFELYFQQQGKRLSGRSYVFFGESYAVMEFTGIMLDKDHIHFNETRIVEATELLNLIWCLKDVDLRLDTAGPDWRLTGEWRGYTTEGSACVPGRVFLKKEVPRA